ncbi:MAG: ABC transporter substrate-binding protein [Gemella sp.]|nr:ABC transporter substrate-binding protein [Gemella sp.]
MKNKKFLKVFSSAMAVSLVVAGCSTGSSSSSSSKKEGAAANVEFKPNVENGGNAVESTLKYGVLSPDSFTGVFNPVFYLQATDGAVGSLLWGETFPTDDKYRIKENDENGAVKVSVNKETKEATLTVHKDLKWSNGEPVTAKDIVATYEMMGNPKYTENTRYEDAYENIQGMKEYHEGKADKISGLTEVDEKTVKIKYETLSPGLLWGNGFLFNFLNAKQVEEASKDFSKLAEADLSAKPLSYGPYQIDQVVPGEAVSLKANEHFFKKNDVKLKKIEVKRVTPAQASNVMKNGEVDVMGDITAEVWKNTKDLKNGALLGQPARYISYVGFKLGKFDKEKGEVVVDPNAKAADVRVREAFGLAVDWDKLQSLYEGLRKTPTGSGFYPPIVDYIYNKDNATGLKYDPEAAKKLLDEAGLKDTNGDGLREDKNGKELKFNFAIRNVGQSFDQALADTFLKYWKEVGLNVQLTDGKLMEPKDWTAKVQSDDPSIDLFQGAWGLGTDPNPGAIVGAKSQLNLQRYTSDKLTGLLNKFDTEEMFDDAKLVAAYQEFDKQFAAERPWLPFSWNTDITWVNSRVKDYDLRKSSTKKFYELELTAAEPNKG